MDKSAPGHVLDLSGVQPVSAVVSPWMFGGNLVFDRDRVDAAGTFGLAAEQLGLTTLRYPGGSVTEALFDIANPDATTVFDPSLDRDKPLLPLSDFMDYARSAGIAPVIVLPTRPALAEGAHGERLVDADWMAALRGYVRDLLEGRWGAADILAFEVGNEYWGSGRMTGTEYGRVADAYAVMLQDEIDRHRALYRDEAWVEPKIAVQFGQAGAYSTGFTGWEQNNQIIDALSPEARGAIDAVVAHYYSRVEYEALSDREWTFDRLDLWTQRPGLEHVDFYITEWNISRHNEHEIGVQYAQHLLGMFATMLARGVDGAWAWPVQQNTGTELSRNEGNRELTHSGQVFARLAERVAGAELVGVAQDGPDLGVQHYRTEWADVLYLSSRSEAELEVVLELDRFGAGFEASLTSVVATVMGYHGDPFVRLPVPEFRIHSGVDLSDGVVRFTLAPWEIAEVVLTYGAHGVQLSALSVEAPVAGVAYDARITGTPFDDVLRGGSGDDTLIGGAGNDTLEAVSGNNALYGGPGEDLLLGGPGNDLLRGGPGNDTIHGGGGNNVIHGDEGNDLIFGGPGNDTIFGGPGDDTIFGGAGNNHINAGQGRDIVYGGPGADVFVFRLGHDELRVMDFDPGEGDRLRLDPALWGGGALSGAEVVALFGGLEQGRHAVLEFGGEDRVMLHGFADLELLAAAVEFL